MMEGYWPAVARGDEEAPPAMREWAVKLEAKPKYAALGSIERNVHFSTIEAIRARLATVAPVPEHGA